MKVEQAKIKTGSDVWVSTQCGRCYANCAIRVRRLNDVAVKIEGEPGSTMGAEGGLCAKGIAACSGHWARGLPIARGKGTNFDNLLKIDLDHVDPVSLNLETAVRVKV